MSLQDTHLLLTGGMEKILRVYDLNKPDVAPKELDKSPGSVRTVAWLHNDQTILSSCTDTGGVRCVCVSVEEMPLFWYPKHVLVGYIALSVSNNYCGF